MFKRYGDIVLHFHCDEEDEKYSYYLIFEAGANPIRTINGSSSTNAVEKYTELQSIKTLLKLCNYKVINEEDSDIHCWIRTRCDNKETGLNLIKQIENTILNDKTRT